MNRGMRPLFWRCSATERNGLWSVASRNVGWLVRRDSSKSRQTAAKTSKKRTKASVRLILKKVADVVGGWLGPPEFFAITNWVRVYSTSSVHSSPCDERWKVASTTNRYLSSQLFNKKMCVRVCLHLNAMPPYLLHNWPPAHALITTLIDPCQVHSNLNSYLDSISQLNSGQVFESVTKRPS